MQLKKNLKDNILKPIHYSSLRQYESCHYFRHGVPTYLYAITNIEYEFRIIIFT